MVEATEDRAKAVEWGNEAKAQMSEGISIYSHALPRVPDNSHQPWDSSSELGVS